MAIQDLDPEKLKFYLNNNGQTKSAKNRRLFEVRFKIKFESDLPQGEWDRGLISDYLKRRAAQVLRAVVEDENPEWEITITAEGRYQGMG